MSKSSFSAILVLLLMSGVVVCVVSEIAGMELQHSRYLAGRENEWPPLSAVYLSIHRMAWSVPMLALGLGCAMLLRANTGMPRVVWLLSITTSLYLVWLLFAFMAVFMAYAVHWQIPAV